MDHLLSYMKKIFTHLIIQSTKASAFKSPTKFKISILNTSIPTLLSKISHHCNKNFLDQNYLDKADKGYPALDFVGIIMILLAMAIISNFIVLPNGAKFRFPQCLPKPRKVPTCKKGSSSTKSCNPSSITKTVMTFLITHDGYKIRSKITMNRAIETRSLC